MGGLWGGLNSGGSIEKLLPLLMLLNKQNISSQSTQTQGTNQEQNQSMNMFKLLSESGLLSKNFSPDKLKLFEMLMNMNNQKSKQNNTPPENEETKSTSKTYENSNKKEDTNSQEPFYESPEEADINNFYTTKNVRE